MQKTCNSIWYGCNGQSFGGPSLQLREDDSDKALLWLRAHSGHEFVGPSFLPVEVASVLRQKMCRGEMDADQCIMALGFLERLDIRYEWDPAASEKHPVVRLL